MKIPRGAAGIASFWLWPMSTEYCISTNALGLTPLMRTKTTQGADERRETATPIPAPIQLEAVLPLLSRICSTTKAVAGTGSGAQPRQPEENPSRREACSEGGRGEAFLSPLQVGECEDDAAGGRSVESGGPRDAGWPLGCCAGNAARCSVQSNPSKYRCSGPPGGSGYQPGAAAYGVVTSSATVFTG